MHYTKPRPTKLLAPVRASQPIESYRNVFCAHYAGCIDVAVKQGWSSFTCVKCPHFHEGRAPHARDYAFDQPHGP